MESLVLILKSALIGVVEGITEFLPVSSTGHIVVVGNAIQFQGIQPHYVEMYTYVIQLGAILAVVLLYWNKIYETLQTLIPGKTPYKDSGLRFWVTICIACIPGAIAQLSLDKLSEKYLFNPTTVALALFFGGIAMLWAEKKFRPSGGSDDINVTVKQALIIGTFQCLAIIPGMSRSASTIIGGWVAGLSSVAAAEFSFFLAIPVMLGMSALKIVKLGGFSLLSSGELVALAVGFVVSFVVALVVIKQFIAYLKKKPMAVFAYYRMIFAGVIVAAGFMGIFR